MGGGVGSGAGGGGAVTLATLAGVARLTAGVARLAGGAGRLGEAFALPFSLRGGGAAFRTAVVFLPDRAFTARRCFANPLASCGPLTPRSLSGGRVNWRKSNKLTFNGSSQRRTDRWENHQDMLFAQILEPLDRVKNPSG